MTYTEAVQYLYDRLPMFQRVGAVAFKKDLTNTRKLLAVLGNPETQFKSIHIAGTNGKGSVSNMMAAGLQANGYKTGLYTSPHLVSFTERIRINGEEMPEESVVAFVLQMKEAIEEIQPSFFEVTVAMAFHHFAQQAVDVAVVEVGMGGRLDSTNVIQPLLSVITNIHWDHADHLGDTLAKIAGEKAGIIKAGAPVIIGRTQAETQPVFLAKALDLGCPITFADQVWQSERISGNLDHQVLAISPIGVAEAETFALDLPGLYQLENARTVWEAFRQLPDLGLPLNHGLIVGSLARVKALTGFKGRMTKLKENPLVVCDVGHNEDGIRAVLAQLDTMQYDQLHFVWGMVSDKDASKILNLLPMDAKYYFVRPAVPRGRDAADLAAQAKEYGLLGQVFSTVQSGLVAAKENSNPSDLIFVGGSTFVVAEVVE